MSETVITVNIPDTKRSDYKIFINDNPLSTLKSQLDKVSESRKRLVIISQKVFKLYHNELGFDKSELFILKDGETQKNIKNYSKIIRKCISLKLSRKDLIIAIGGGVVGDMAGFVAATYMRGIEFVQVPTTLLACVDSSVGGKTAIDMPDGKNFVGAFYQPCAVFINLNFLKSLDETQYKSGFGEVLKYAFIEKSCNSLKSHNLFELLKTSYSDYDSRNLEFLKRIIEISLELKSAVVNQDEKEKGLRRILNLGHTFGHALEEATKYKRFAHGVAVVYGLMFVFNYALKYEYCERKYYDEAFTLMTMYGYESKKLGFVNWKKVFGFMKTDKKSDGGSITFVVPVTQGVVEVLKDDKLEGCNSTSAVYQNV
jgi:3-dehydroquinate synthase